jgi:DNA-binding NarL/FixJ family response regulator
MMSYVPRQVDRRPTIWLVEDSTLYRQTLADMVEKSGRLRCTQVFGDAEAALQALAEGGELPRLILMDLGLPGMSGSECVREIRLRHPAIPVVMLTVHQSNDKIFETICAGASGYLLKSAPRDQILHGIENVLEGGAAMDAHIARRVLEMFTRMVTPQADYGLSDRERQILHHLVEGHTKGQIAERLDLSPHTIDGHVRNIYMKLHVNNRTGAVAKALREHLL